MTPSTRAFDGVSVLELGHFVAVPWAGQILADGGAHVVKIEPREGEPSRHIAPLAPGESRHFVIRNRGKHTLPLELKHPHAREILDALLSRADVVLAALGASSRYSATPIAASVFLPSGVTERARLSGMRAISRRARNASASAAPTAPEIWWRRSVQSMQLRQ